jgi:hypothetical protein
MNNVGRGAARRSANHAGKAPRAAVTPGRAVDARWIGPDAEVADVKQPVEAHAERRLERDHAGVHLVEPPVDVARRTQDHDGAPLALAS